jgi:hypothetical protein
VTSDFRAPVFYVARPGVREIGGSRRIFGPLKHLIFYRTLRAMAKYRPVAPT